MKIKSKYDNLLDYFLYDDSLLDEKYVEKSREYLKNLGKQRGKLDNNPNRSNLFKSILDKKGVSYE